MIIFAIITPPAHDIIYANKIKSKLSISRGPNETVGAMPPQNVITFLELAD
jgi:hypothetical protein